MAYKALLFGTDDLYPQLKPFYDAEVERGNLEIAAVAVFENGTFNFVTEDGKPLEADNSLNFDLVIISSQKYFYNRMKFLEASGFNRDKIIDGKIFQIPNFDFPRFIKEGIAHGVFEDRKLIKDNYFSPYPRMYTIKHNPSIILLGRKSYIYRALLEGIGFISVGNFSSISWDVIFNMLKDDHDWRNVTTYGMDHLDWVAQKEFYPSSEIRKILIGSDVWIGRGSNLKCSNPEKPLIIGDGAVIASESVVVKNVPPYAIVGGNPAQIIKYRFPSYVIHALLRIKWWDWSLDKIHDNFKYFNDIERFISLHDKE